MKTDLLLIRVNMPDMATAEQISAALIQEKLAACTNISGPVQARYVWQGELAQSEEYVVWIKAPAALWPRIEARIRALHPHDTPAILALPVIHANEDFAQWVVDRCEE